MVPVVQPMIGSTHRPAGWAAGISLCALQQVNSAGGSAVLLDDGKPDPGARRTSPPRSPVSVLLLLTAIDGWPAAITRAKIEEILTCRRRVGVCCCLVADVRRFGPGARPASRQFAAGAGRGAGPRLRRATPPRLARRHLTGQAVAREASVLQRAGWPLYALVDKFSAGAPMTDEANCIAVAVYHEARGESLEGQMAVAKVIMNRAASGKYPTSWCGVVKQPWQFSFVNPPRASSVRRPGLGRLAQGARRDPARGRQCGAERAGGVPVVSRRLCRSVVGPKPDAGRKDRRAHLLSRLTAPLSIGLSQRCNSSWR